MARRPEPENVMSKEQISEFERKVSMLSDSGVEGIYQSDTRNAGSIAKSFRNPPPFSSWLRPGECCGSLGTLHEGRPGSSVQS